MLSEGKQEFNQLRCSNPTTIEVNAIIKQMLSHTARRGSVEVNKQNLPKETFVFIMTVISSILLRG